MRRTLPLRPMQALATSLSTRHIAALFASSLSPSRLPIHAHTFTSLQHPPTPCLPPPHPHHHLHTLTPPLHSHRFSTASSTPPLLLLVPPRPTPPTPPSIFNPPHSRHVAQRALQVPALPDHSPLAPQLATPSSESGPSQEAVLDLEARLIPGKRIARRWLADLAGQAAELRGVLGRAPGLAVVQVGAREDSRIYVKNKAEACREVGIHFEEVNVPHDVTQSALQYLVTCVCRRPDIDGVLIQLPLPAHLDEEAIMLTLDPKKDVDGFHPLNMGRVLMRGIPTRFIPCTPLGCMHMLLALGVDVVGKRAVIIGDSNIVGTPMAMLLRDQGAGFVTVCHRAAYASWFGDKDVEERIRAHARACAPRLPGPTSKQPRALPPGLRHPNPESQMAHVGRDAGDGSAGGTLGQLGVEGTLQEVTRAADIVVVAVGIPLLVRGDWVKPGAVVLDVGINVVPTSQVGVLEGGEGARLHDQSRQLFQVNGNGSRGRAGGAGCRAGAAEKVVNGSRRGDRNGYSLVGDVALKEVLGKVSYVTPVPGGVGPTTIAALVHNVLQAARYGAGIQPF